MSMKKAIEGATKPKKAAPKAKVSRETRALCGVAPPPDHRMTFANETATRATRAPRSFWVVHARAPREWIYSAVGEESSPGEIWIRDTIWRIRSKTGTDTLRLVSHAQYIDPIVQATFQQDGQIREIVQCLSARMRDPSQTVRSPLLSPGPIRVLTTENRPRHRPQVVFKSLIVLHTIMRSGQLDAVFSYLSTSSTSLSLSSPEAANVAAYGQYLACRIKSYGNLKRDVVRDKSDRRAANRLKTLTVEQGLLRETREIQRMIAALVEAKVSLLAGPSFFSTMSLTGCW